MGPSRDRAGEIAPPEIAARERYPLGAVPPSEVITTDRILGVLEGSYAADLARRATEELRAMRSECGALETSVSYSRRLAQARTEILTAEQTRRAQGGSLSELIERLPSILAGGGERADAANTRHAEPDEAIVDLVWPDGRQHLLEDDSLANLPTISDSDLAETITALRDFEHDLSHYRRSLHGVIDAIEHEIATRAAADA